jgi:hypothetical protein
LEAVAWLQADIMPTNKRQVARKIFSNIFLSLTGIYGTNRFLDFSDRLRAPRYL